MGLCTDIAPRFPVSGYAPRVRETLTWVEGNAECLPFEDCSFDLYTIAFGLRNVTNRCVLPIPMAPESKQAAGMLDRLTDPSIHPSINPSWPTAAARPWWRRSAC